jgi:polysaccharide export outer membrane protein
MPGGLAMPLNGPGPLAAMPARQIIPTELQPRSLPPYVVEPPDILLIDTTRLVPKPPYTVSALDVLLIRVADPLPNQPIEGSYTVAPDGTVNLGYSYGFVRIGGMTIDQVEKTIRDHLRRVLRDPQVAVGLQSFRAVQMVQGQHLVRPDGTVSMGSYGCVYVAGLTLQQVKVAIERHLTQYVLDPEINVDVLAYNSKVYYIIADGAGFGQQVFRLPITGKETVLDAIGTITGLPAQASKKKIWVARPAPPQHHCVQVLPVDWKAITEGGSTATNYQLFPGDRIYIGPDPFILADNWMAKILGPVERMFGITLLATTTVNSFRNNGSGNGGAAFIAPLR